MCYNSFSEDVKVWSQYFSVAILSSWTALERVKNDRLFIKSQVTYARGSFQTWISRLWKSQKTKTTFPFISRDWIWKVHSKASKMRKCSSFQCNPTDEHNASMQLERGCFMVAAVYLYKFSSPIFPPDSCSNSNICNHAAPGFLTLSGCPAQFQQQVVWTTWQSKFVNVIPKLS